MEKRKKGVEIRENDGLKLFRDRDFSLRRARSVFTTETLTAEGRELPFPFFRESSEEEENEEKTPAGIRNLNLRKRENH